jgi:hypothetical protein
LFVLCCHSDPERSEGRTPHFRGEQSDRVPSKINFKNLQNPQPQKTTTPKTALSTQSTTSCPQIHHTETPKIPKTPAKQALHHTRKYPAIEIEPIWMYHQIATSLFRR